MRRLVVAMLSGLLTVASPARPSDGDIAILAEVTGTGRTAARECDFWRVQWNNSSRGKGKTPFGSCQPPVLEVYANLSGASAGGITGVEFGVRLGADRYPDPGYILIEIPTSTPIVKLGSAFTPPDAERRGMNLVWSTCQQGTNGRVYLGRVLVLPTAPCGPNVMPPKLEMTVGQHWWPSNRYLRCPLFTLCDAPAYTKICLGSDYAPCDLEVPPFSRVANCSSSGTFVINGAHGIGRCKSAKQEADAAPQTWSQVKSLFR